MTWYLPPWVVRHLLYVLRSKSVYFRPLRVGSREEAASKNSSMSTGVFVCGRGEVCVRGAGFTDKKCSVSVYTYVHTFL